MPRSPGAETELFGLMPHPGIRPAVQPAGSAGAAELSTPLTVMAVALCYFLGSLLGLSLPFPSTQISAIWPPNAILLAVLLLTPRRRWWIYLLAVFPVHLLVQMLKEIPLQIVLINFAGNIGEAVLGAVAILHYAPEPRRFDRLRTVLAVMLFGGLVAPALSSLMVAALFAWMGLDTAPFLTWLLRLLTDALAVLTLVPSIVLAATQVRSSLWRTLSLWRVAEAASLLVALLAVGIFIFLGPEAGPGRTPIHLYAPFPFLLWAAVRFGLPGISLSVLLLNAVAVYGAIQGHGPFTAQLPIENAASLVLFLLVTCAPLQMLAALLSENEIMQEKHRRAETLHDAVLTSLQDHICVVDREGVIIEVNESWQHFVRDNGLGWMNRASLGVNYLEVCRTAARSHRDADSEKALAGLEAILGGDRERFQMEYFLTGSGELWFEMSAEPLRRPEGGAVIRHTDITGRRKAEQEAREQRRELAHLTRVALLGELSGALAHELNQPLTAILSNAQAGQRLLAQEPVDLAEIREVLKDIADDDRRAGAVIHRLRAMLKKEELALQPLDLGEVAREVLDLAHSDLVTRNVRVTTRLAARLPPVRGDRVQLQQVLLNLVLNACESIATREPSERKLTITTARVADGVQVSVRDRGTGIAAGAMSRLFEPFFTTKQHGLGLGLSICRSIVAEHGGRLWATNNEEEGGATFYLVLPAAEPAQP